MHRTRLSGKVGAALDPCAAIQVPFELARRPGARDRLPARRRDSNPRCGQRAGCSASAATAAARDALDAVSAVLAAHARRGAGRNARPALNVLANGWLLYQTLACRLWARSGYYQSGGAFGFRDQLQDAMALVHAEPPLLREQIAALRRAASSSKATSSTGGIRPSGRGVRTHCSDDYLWLPLATCRYVLTHRRHRRARRNVALPRRPPGQCRRTTPTTTCPAASDDSGELSTSTACARSCTACASARTACR